MTGKEKVYLVLLLLLVVVVGVLENTRPKGTDWSPSFSRYHKKPYGCKYLYARLPDLFGPGISTGDRSEAELRSARWREEDGPINHLYVSSGFHLPQRDVDALLAQVAAGDQLFIAAWELGSILQDTLGLATTRMFDRDAMTVRFLAPTTETRPFDYTNMPQPGSFAEHPEAATVLAVNDRSEPVLIHLAWGEGDLWLCAEPRLFTNYNLLERKNAELIAHVLSHLPQGPVRWNEFRKLDPQGETTPLRWILAQPALHWAYFLSLALVLLYLFTHARRQQRAIPIVPPVRNDSRDFVHTMGRLYYNKGDHADLARKMITYFKDDLRQRAHIHKFAADAETADRLAKRTGLTVNEITPLLRRITDAEAQPRMSALQLTELDRVLHHLRSRL